MQLSRIAHRLPLIPGFALCLATLCATAQIASTNSVQQRYDRQIALCNSGNLPAPQRDACVRDAGRALDNANGGTPPEPVPQPSTDGRSVVMTPPGSPPPNTSDYVTSPDGRSVTAVPPPGDRIQRP